MPRRRGVNVDTTFGEGPPPKIWEGKKRLKLGMISDNYRVRSRKSPKGIHISKIGKVSDQLQPVPRWKKQESPAIAETRATLAKSLHGLRKSSGVLICIGRLPIDSVSMVSYYVLYSNCVCKMRRFGDTRLLKLP